MDPRQFNFLGAGGCSLFAQAWEPSEPLRGLLALVHGVGEHSDRYGNLVEPLIERRFGVWGFDLRGHGRSEGRPGHIVSWSEYREDLHRFHALIRESHPTLPQFIYGHSLGSLIVLESLLRDPAGWTGAVLSGLPIEPVGIASPVLILIAKLLTRLWPTFSIDIGIDSQDLSRDPIVVRAYDQDPMVQRKVTTRWGTESLDAVEWVKANLASLSLPVLILHGQADPMHASAGAQFAFETIGSEQKAIQVYPDGAHEVHNDLDHSQVALDLAEWLERFSD